MKRGREAKRTQMKKRKEGKYSLKRKKRKTNRGRRRRILRDRRR
jgi:hypothetical protein